ncbi:hypothetical protein RJ639_039141 [Escallonia herrerae]|uniref:Plant-specific domain TIGR01615 family protein n=1 Tax=Escallonia herrerae TaxID=1293975 RepID=A0AA89BAC7_9ASTE|nr:hypothetical protein RJ639_039141 [Escallonia herrerae]
MDCRVVAVTGDMWLRMGGGGVSDSLSQIGGGFSHESEHDLAVMVSDFLENGGGSGGGGAESRWSSDSDSGLLCDLGQLADKISHYKLSMLQYERDLLSVVNCLMLSINEIDLELVKSGPCNASCIRFSLAKLLRHSGYEAAVCASKWQGSGRVPGGDHEYIDITNYNDSGSSERLIVDIDFRSHFEIARAVESYDRVLNSLPTVYVGSLTKLKQYLQVMVEAARSSLKQNSMPLPPWRSLAYLQAKWESPHQRQFNLDEQIIVPSDHKQCSGQLKRLQSLLQSDIEVERLLKHRQCHKNRKLKVAKRSHSSLRTN